MPRFGAEIAKISNRRKFLLYGITKNFDILIQERCFFVGSICFIQLKFHSIYTSQNF